jgi:hypothetical protein
VTFELGGSGGVDGPLGGGADGGGVDIEVEVPPPHDVKAIHMNAAAIASTIVRPCLLQLDEGTAFGADDI